MKKVIFLTGSTGFLGQNLIHRILRGDSATRLILLVRGNSDGKACQRLNEILRMLPQDIDTGEAKSRIESVRGDVSLSRLGLSETIYNSLAENVTHIIHSAATVQFQLPLESARAVNCLGTKNVLKLAYLARARGNLQRVAYISTAYISGSREGLISEQQLDCGQRFANTYEQSKFEAEQIVRGSMSALPMTIFRPSIIVGDSKTGRTTSFNVLYTPLKLIYRGLVKILPGSRYTPVDVVPVDFVSGAIHYIFLQTLLGIGETYHLTTGGRKATTSGEIADLAVDYFNRMAERRHVSHVKFLPLKLYGTVKRCLRLQAKRVMQGLEAYEPYFCIRREFDNANTRAALKGTDFGPPQFRTYYQNLLQFCIDVNWGNRMNLAA